MAGLVAQLCAALRCACEASFLGLSSPPLLYEFGFTPSGISYYLPRFVEVEPVTPRIEPQGVRNLCVLVGKVYERESAPLGGGGALTVPPVPPTLGVAVMRERPSTVADNVM